MSTIEICQTLKSELGGLFTCTEEGDFQRVRTPFLYPDGDNIDLFCKSAGDVITVTDLAETGRWLRMQTTTMKRSTKQRKLIDDVCQTHGVEMYKGMILARCRNGDSLAAVVTRVAQAALRMSDLWFTFRTRAVESITDEVADYLLEQNIGYVRGERLSGRSGRSWNVDFHVRTSERSSLVFVLSTGNRSAARSVTEHVLSAWYDLSHLVSASESLQCVSLFDDTTDVWAEEDYKLVEDLSRVTHWSRPDEFAHLLSEAA